MNRSLPRAEELRQAFGPNQRGAVGVADELLAVCRERPLQLEWQSGTCRVSSSEAAVEVPLPKSVFRAILARLAALCNENVTNSVTPYGGSGEVAFGEEAFHITFANTPDEQRAEVRFVGTKVSSVNPAAPVGVPDARVTSPGSA